METISHERQVVERHKLDVLTRAPIRAYVGIFVPSIAALCFLSVRDSNLGLALGTFIAGYFVWTFFEYWTHRTILHWEPQQPLLARLHWMGHGHHHSYPGDPLRLVFPLVFSVPIQAVVVAIFVTLIGTHLGWGVSAGWVSGYFVMDGVHYLIHRRRPRSNLGRRIHELHMRHHFQHGSHAYGTTSPWWDRVFGTAPPQKGRREAQLAESGTR